MKRTRDNPLGRLFFVPLLFTFLWFSLSLSPPPQLYFSIPLQYTIHQPPCVQEATAACQYRSSKVSSDRALNPLVPQVPKKLRALYSWIPPSCKSWLRSLLLSPSFLFYSRLLVSVYSVSSSSFHFPGSGNRPAERREKEEEHWRGVQQKEKELFIKKERKIEMEMEISRKQKRIQGPWSSIPPTSGPIKNKRIQIK